MEEQLKIKLVVDMSDLKASVNQAKKTVSSVGTETDGVKKSVGETDKSFDNLKATLTSIQGLNFMELIINSLDLTKEKLADVGKAFGTFKTELFGLGGSKDMLKNGFQALFTNSYWEETYGKDFIPEKNWSGLKKRFQEFGGYGKETASGVKGAIAGVGTALSGLATAINPVILAIGVALAGIVALVAEIAIIIKLTKAWITNAINLAKELHKVNLEAGKINMSVQSYQEWGYVLKQCGLEADKLTDFVKKMTEKQNELREGSEDVANAFKELGISQEEVLSSSSPELFEKTVEKLQGIENATQRASLAERVFTDDFIYLGNILSLTNDEMKSLVDNYYNLGAAPSENLTKQSALLNAHTTNLSYAWQGIKNTLAEAILPIIIKIVGWLTTAVSVVSVFLKALFGVEDSGKSSFNNVSSGVNNFTGSINNATKAAKELRRITMGFDELNVMPSTKSGSGSGIGDLGSNGGFGGGSFSADIPVIKTPDLTKLKEWVEKYKTIIQTVVSLGLIAIGILTMIMGGPLLGPVGGALAGLGIIMGSMKGGPLDIAKAKVVEALKNMKSWFETNIVPIFTKAYWVDKWDKVKTSATEKIDEIKTDLKNSGLAKWYRDDVKPIFTKQYWIDKWNNIKKAFTEKMDEIHSNLYNSKLAVWFRTKAAPIFTKDYWATKWNNIKSGATTKISELYSSLYNSKFFAWVRNSILPKFTTTYWSNKFGTIKDGAKSAFNGLIGIVETAVNNIIKKINTLSWDIPDWVPKVGGEKFGFDFKQVKIPRLATGGIAVSSTLANIGEAGKEAILPIENNTGWMDMLADRIAARTPQAPTRLVLKVGERELGYATIGAINNITQQTGELQLVMA